MSTSNVSIPAYFPKSEIKNEGPSIAVIAVTPEIASFWLKSYNHGNRKMSRQNVLFLKQQMESGQWVPMNGDTISFLPDGTLNDGQHRLQAVIEAKKTFPFLVMVGVDSGSFKVKDTGKKRGAADVLGIEGYKSAPLLAAACKFIISWKEGQYSDATGSGHSRLTNATISDFAKKHRAKLEQQALLAYNYYKMGEKAIMPSSWVLGLLFLFSEKDVKFAERFLFKLCTGDSLEFGTTLFYLRKRLINAALSDSMKIPARTKLALIVKTWNCERTGKRKKRLQFSPATGEKFPTII